MRSPEGPCGMMKRAVLCSMCARKELEARDRKRDVEGYRRLQLLEPQNEDSLTQVSAGG
jgi:hypothetical protein